MTAAQSPGPLGILGGTFDPIHNGHLRLGEEAIQQLCLTRVRFIPAGQPPLRDRPCVSADHRLAMTKLAISANPCFEVDNSEVTAKQPSYTVDTLARLRREIGPLGSLVLLLGNDAFERLSQWHRWQEIFSLAHIAVATRPDTQVVNLPVGAGDTPSSIGLTRNTPLECAAALANEVRQRRGSAVDLATSPCGHIVPFTIPALDISATAIRRQLKDGHPPRYLVAESVVRYIDLHHLYR
jgi:nicotinate-nucleotide adenylyltransferase